MADRKRLQTIRAADVAKSSSRQAIGEQLEKARLANEANNISALDAARGQITTLRAADTRT